MQLRGSSSVSMLQNVYAEASAQLEPGTLIALDRLEQQHPYCAVVACPACGGLGLITQEQCCGRGAVFCRSEACSAEYVVRDGVVRMRALQ